MGFGAGFITRRVWDGISQGGGRRGIWAIGREEGASLCGLSHAGGGGCRRWQEMPLQNKIERILVSYIVRENSFLETVGFFSISWGCRGSKSSTSVRAGGVFTPRGGCCCSWGETGNWSSECKYRWVYCPKTTGAVGTNGQGSCNP